MVAGHQELASQPDREIEHAFCAVQLGLAQRPRVLDLPLRSDVGSFGDLFFLSRLV